MNSTDSATLDQPSDSVARPPLAVLARGVHHRYGDHVALDGVDLQIPAGQIFALLGPNGSGKTTLFRLLSTLMPLQQGTLEIAGASVTDVMAVRRRIGIVFQSPSLDKKLTVRENIHAAAALYGIRGPALRTRASEVLHRLGLTDRADDFCERLSGGLKRRVELAKGMLHGPQVLLLDEPSTGLDPGARLDLWQALQEFTAQGLSVVLTTHLLEEAEKADQIAILSQGQVIVCDSPERLRSELGNGLVTITTDAPQEVCQSLNEQWNIDAQALHNQVRFQCDDPGRLIAPMLDTLGERAINISIGRPSLEDVFIARTGYRFDAVAPDADTNDTTDTAADNH